MGQGPQWDQPCPTRSTMAQGSLGIGWTSLRKYDYIFDSRLIYIDKR